MKTKHYYYDLPENYTCVKVIDAKAKKETIIMLVANIIIIAAIFGLGILILKLLYPGVNLLENANPLVLLIGIAVMFLYIILHELTHGLFYKIFTHEKLTFGLTLTVAYCGVPRLYVDRKTAIVSTLAPFVIFNIVFLGLIFLIPNLFIKLVLLFIFAMHFGGCIGDLWVASILIFQHRDKKMLVNDTGPKQSFYIEESSDGNQVS